MSTCPCGGTGLVFEGLYICARCPAMPSVAPRPICKDCRAYVDLCDCVAVPYIRPEEEAEARAWLQRLDDMRTDVIDDDRALDAELNGGES